MAGRQHSDGRLQGTDRGLDGGVGHRSDRHDRGDRGGHRSALGSQSPRDLEGEPREAAQLRELKRTVFDILDPLDRALQARGHALDCERADLHAQRERVQARREELITLRAELEQQLAAATVARYGIFASCVRPTVTEQAIEIEARRERRREIANCAKEAFEGADENDDRVLTLDELRQIEGDNAEVVMMEADVNGDGVLSKREYVNYKLHIAKQVGRMARKAFKQADVNDDKELTLEELRAIEGDNAETVMREADVDGGGSLSKREYVDYKIRCAAHGAMLLR